MAAVTASSEGVGPFFAEYVDDYLFEGEPEVLAEHGVDARIYGRVAVPEPEQYAEDRGVYAVRVVAERPYQVHREEGHPAENESAHYYRQGLGRLRLHPYSLDLIKVKNFILLATKGRENQMNSRVRLL